MEQNDDQPEIRALATVERHDMVGHMTFDEMVLMGDKLVRTGFLPPHLKNGAQVAAIVMAGRELGLGTMRSLRSLTLVKGKVTEYADSQLARFKSDGGHAKFLHLDESKAVLWLQHPNGDEHTETFAVDDARRAGLLNDGGNYGKFPKAMLRSRAITAGLKSIGWEGGAGNYDPSELTIDPPTHSEPAIQQPVPPPGKPPPSVEQYRTRIAACTDFGKLKHGPANIRKVFMGPDAESLLETNRARVTELLVEDAAAATLPAYLESVVETANDPVYELSESQRESILIATTTRRLKFTEFNKTTEQPKMDDIPY